MGRSRRLRDVVAEIEGDIGLQNQNYKVCLDVTGDTWGRVIMKLFYPSSYVIFIKDKANHEIESWNKKTGEIWIKGVWDEI